MRFAIVALICATNACNGFRNLGTYEPTLGSSYEEREVSQKTADGTALAGVLQSHLATQRHVMDPLQAFRMLLIELRGAAGWQQVAGHGCKLSPSSLRVPHTRSRRASISARLPSEPFKLDTRAREPWLLNRAATSGHGDLSSLLAPETLREMADEIDRIRLTELSLCQAYKAGNSPDMFLYDGPQPLQWMCYAKGGGCEGIANRLWGDPEISISEVADSLQAPIAARITCRARDEGHLPEKLSNWFSELEAVIGRPYQNIDAYFTKGTGPSSASGGWHVDYVDVLTIMLRGSKRFRVAGKTVGSPVEIDTVLSSGDLLYFPSLRFHTGGDVQVGGFFGFGGPEFEDSLMLSLAFPQVDADIITVSDEWSLARNEAMKQVQPHENNWKWAATGEGKARLATIFKGSPAECFISSK